MEKPTIIKLKEIEEEIINIINSSNVPPFVLKPTIEKIYRQLEILEQQEYETEKENYENSLKEKESDK